MSNQARQRELRDAVERALSEQLGAERYRRRQLEVTSGRARTTEGARPMEFDESGFPLPQRNRSFVQRVAQVRQSLSGLSRK
jgi:hypothetical protein